MKLLKQIIWAVILIAGISVALADLYKNNGNKARVLTIEEATRREKLLRDSN